MPRVRWAASSIGVEMTGFLESFYGKTRDDDSRSFPCLEQTWTTDEVNSRPEISPMESSRGFEAV